MVIPKVSLGSLPPMFHIHNLLNKYDQYLQMFVSVNKNGVTR